MDPIQLKINQRVHLIVDLLSNAVMSEEGHDSTQTPFFMNGPTTEFKGHHKDMMKVPEGLNTNIKYLYEIIGNPKVEVTLTSNDSVEWTILSQEKALEHYDKYVADGQHRVFEIAYRYMGMGHIECLSCDLQTHNLFYHWDGGSSGYDREYHYKQMLAYSGDVTQSYFLHWVSRFQHPQSSTGNR